MSTSVKRSGVVVKDGSPLGRVFRNVEGYWEVSLRAGVVEGEWYRLRREAVAELVRIRSE